MNCVFHFAFVVCILCRVDICIFKVVPYPCVFYFCVLFNQQMNIVLFHLNDRGAVAISRYELLRTSEQQMESEVILKHIRKHVSWKNED